MRRVTYVVGLVFCSVFFLISALIGLGGPLYNQGCELKGDGQELGYSTKTQYFPPGTRCVFELKDGSTREAFQPVDPGMWLWTASCVAIGAVPLSLLFRIKAAQDAKRGGPSL